MTETPQAQSGNGQLLTVQNLEVRYGVTQVIWGISLAVATGKVTCIIGSNGAGKTTTLNAIAGILPGGRRNKKAVGED